MAIFLLPLDTLDWRTRAPVHRAAARPRLRVPRDRLPPAAKTQPRHRHLSQIRYWFAFPAPMGQEIAAAQTAWRRALTRPLAVALFWVPLTTDDRPLWPGYVLVLTDQPLLSLDTMRLQRALYGEFGDTPVVLDPACDIPWDQIAWDAGWLADPAQRALINAYRS